MTELLKTAIEALEKLPEPEQERYAATILEDLQVATEDIEEAEDEGKAEPYSSFQILIDAKLDGPEDASVTYERDLYGRTHDLDG